MSSSIVPVAAAAVAARQAPGGVGNNRGWLPPRFDLGTWSGRFQRYAQIVNPLTLLTPIPQLREAQDLLRKYDAGLVPPSEANKQALYNAYRLRDAIAHPDTGEPIPVAFRRAAFVPVNFPLFLGMLVTPVTTPWILFWQIGNQSYNVFLNYFNRNASNKQTNAQVLQTYLLACSAATSLAMGMRMLVQRSQHLPFARTVVGKALMKTVIPYVALAGASSTNCAFTRRVEFLEGVTVRDEAGNRLGTSIKAGRDAVMQTCFSRMLLPIPTLTVPPLVLGYIESRKLVTNKGVKLVIQATLVVCMLFLALPLSLSPFPYIIRRPASQLEPHFHNLKDADGNAITNVQYNRGL